MTVVDLNLLLYAVNENAPHHERARDWWSEQLNGDRPVGLPWLVVLGFLRISTHPRIMTRPLAPADAVMLIDEWLRRPVTRLLVPTDQHWDVLKTLIGEMGTAGNLTSDLHIAALALGHGAQLASADADFARVPNLRWINPLTR